MKRARNRDEISKVWMGPFILREDGSWIRKLAPVLKLAPKEMNTEEEEVEEDVSESSPTTQCSSTLEWCSSPRKVPSLEGDEFEIEEEKSLRRRVTLWVPMHAKPRGYSSAPSIEDILGPNVWTTEQVSTQMASPLLF